MPGNERLRRAQKKETQAGTSPRLDLDFRGVACRDLDTSVVKYPWKFALKYDLLLFLSRQGNLSRVSDCI